MGLLHSMSRSQQRFKLVVNVCVDNNFWTTEHFVAKPVWLCSTINQSVMHKTGSLCSVFNVKFTWRAYVNKIWLFLLVYHINSRSVCNQTLFYHKASLAKVSCGKMGLLCTRSRSQQMFKLSVCLNVSAQYLLNHSTFFFFTKLCMVVYYHEVMCRAEKLVHYFQCQGHSRGLYNQNITVFTISSKLLVCLQPNLVW